jgi:hypothetical protein
MSVFVTIEKSRGQRFTITMTDSAGANISVGASDVVRVKIGRRGSTPILDFGSDAASDNGSTVSRANPTEVVLNDDDAALLSPGVYDVETLVYSAADGMPKHADHGVVAVHGVMGGDVGA